MEFNINALDRRPNLAIKIAQVSAAWTKVECDMGLLLADILGSSARIGVAMYLSLTGTTAQRNVLLAAADHSVPPGLREIFVELLDELRRRSRERNRIVHALWAANPLDNNTLINCPPDNMVRDVADAITFAQSTGDSMTEPSPEFVRKLMIYKASDFDDVITRIHDLRQNIKDFSEKIMLARAQRN